MTEAPFQDQGHCSSNARTGAPPHPGQGLETPEPCLLPKSGEFRSRTAAQCPPRRRRSWRSSGWARWLSRQSWSNGHQVAMEDWPVKKDAGCRARPAGWGLAGPGTCAAGLSHTTLRPRSLVTQGNPGRAMHFLRVGAPGPMWVSGLRAAFLLGQTANSQACSVRQPRDTRGIPVGPRGSPVASSCMGWLHSGGTRTSSFPTHNLTWVRGPHRQGGCRQFWGGAPSLAAWPLALVLSAQGGSARLCPFRACGPGGSALALGVGLCSGPRPHPSFFVVPGARLCSGEGRGLLLTVTARDQGGCAVGPLTPGIPRQGC